MDRETMLAELRSVIDDIVASRYYWPDSRLLGYLSEGQDKFCEETGYFTDITTHTITLEEGVYRYAVPTRVIQVMEIYDGRSRLGKLLTDDISSDGDLRRSGFEVVGMPTHWRTDRYTGGIELSHTPTVIEDGTALQLQVWRYSTKPLDRMSSTITLAGALHAGDVVAATVNGVVYSYAVLGTEGTLTAVATALAAVIDAATSLVATASGQVVSISALAPETSTAASVAVSGAGATVTATAANTYSADPEVPERFHRACIEWAAYKAFNHHDMEAQDPVKATDHLRSFQQYVTDGRAALARIQNHEVRVGTHAAYRT